MFNCNFPQKYTREELERVVIAHVNECLVKYGEPASKYNTTGCGCINQHAYREEDPMRAFVKNPKAAWWFDEFYSRCADMDGVTFEKHLRELGLVEEGA